MASCCLSQPDANLCTSQPPTPFSSPLLYVNRVLALHSSSIVIFLGNVLEVYDWALYGYLEPLLASAFLLSEEMGWIVFGVPFLARPFGAVAMGVVGDRYGRKFALNVCIWSMGLATFLQGCLVQSLPGATLAFLILRFCGGLACGGGAASIVTYVSEVGEEHGGHALVASAGVVNASSALAFLLATATALLITSLRLSDQLAWGWRIPFLVAGPLAGVSFLFREQVAETPAYERLHLKRTSIRMGIGSRKEAHYGSVQQTEATLLKEEVDVASEVHALFLSYLAHTPAVVSNYLPMLLAKWLQDFGAFSQSLALWVCLIAKCTQMLATFPVGFIADELGVTAGLMIGCVGMVLCTLPAFLTVMELTSPLRSEVAAVILLGIVIPVCSAFCVMCSYIFATSLFPAHRRSLCVGITSGLSSATMGVVPLAWISLSQLAPWLPGASYTLLFCPAFLVACYARSAARRNVLTVWQRSRLF
mmetsp:Transcript_29774/g.68561  ORF Transcript_29774/g.68561 Transcript_29774/m.68561 type:complete len:477 (+) Transcript_29774:94-1524(+)